MEKTLLQELREKKDSAFRLMEDFNNEAKSEFLLGHKLQEQAASRLGREFEGRIYAYDIAIDLIIKYIGVSE